MNDQSLRNRARETTKLWLRRALQRADLQIGRGTYAGQVVRTLADRGVDAVLDVGANVGQYARLLRSAGFAGRIVSCEPLEGAFAELERRAARDPRWSCVRTAVGEQPGTTTMHVSANSFSSSIREMTETHREAAPGSQYIAEQRTEVTTVTALCADHGLAAERTLLKIDTQGFEDEVLKGAGDLVGRLAAIQLELSFVELYAGQRLFADLLEAMDDAGYRLQQLEPGFSDAAGRLLQVDGLFVRA